MHDIIRELVSHVYTLFHETIGLSSTLSEYVSELIILLLLSLVSYIAYKITVKLMRGLIIPILQRSKNQFDDFLLKHHFFRNLAYLVPAFIFYYLVEDILEKNSFIGFIIFSGLEVGFVLIGLVILNSVLNTINDFYNRYEFAKDHPIKSVIQIFKIVSYVVGLITIVAILFDRDLSSLVVSLGAVSAVIMLIFKDPILGFVGGLQLIFNKMLSIEDWISMPKFGADGNVKEINLTTVKVQNWDKTIVTIPTYSLITESFQNWRGMQESGGRRIMRSIYINVHSIKFCTPEMIEKYKDIKVLGPYINKTEQKIKVHNTKYQINPDVLVNGRRQTNIGVFRAYLEAYLSNRSDINMDMTFMVRQLEPNEKGLPIQIYVFTNTTEWESYEAIQSDIFDHVLAVVPEFGLQIFQYPTQNNFLP